MQNKTPIWKTRTGKIGIGVGVLILICLCCVVIAYFSPTPQQPGLTQEQIQQTAIGTAWHSFTQTAQALPTFTATVTATPTISITFTPSITPLPTIPPIYDAKTSGFYLVNVDIAPGVWRSNGSGSDCYWAVTTVTGEIISNHFGQAGGTAYISPEAFQVEFNRCGTWVYVQGP